jgi:hypothetical protein
MQKKRAEMAEAISFANKLQQDMGRKLEELEKKKTEHIKEQKRLKEELTAMSNEEIAKRKWILQNADKITAEFLMQNEEVRGLIHSSDDFLHIFKVQMKDAVTGLMDPLKTGLESLRVARELGPLPSQRPAMIEAEKERLRTQLAESMLRMAGAPIPIRLSVPIDIQNNPAINVAVDMSVESISGAIHRIMSEQVEQLEIKINEKFQIDEKAPRVREIEQTQITGVQ